MLLTTHDEEYGLTACHSLSRHVTGYHGLSSPATLLPYLAVASGLAQINQTPLHVACRMGSTPTAELLISKGADVQVEDSVSQGWRGLGQRSCDWTGAGRLPQLLYTRVLAVLLWL